ncbi:hypothetical protein A2U01_0107885, partial [Trifolium medium]|nr:hypothetical protein [Trifolium medium]
MAGSWLEERMHKLQRRWLRWR